MPLPRLVLLLALALVPALAALAVEDEANVERNALAQRLAFGRPTANASASSATLAAQLEQHRAELQANPAAREHTARAAWLDAFGRTPTASELQAEAALSLAYTERLQRHLAHLRAAPEEYRAVIQRAYRLVVHRDAYAEEFDYWRPHGVFPFVVLAACIEDWARRNRPGLMVTAGTPTVPARSRFVTILPLSPALADEARTTLATERAAPESHIITPGAANVATAGGMHLGVFGRD